MSTIRVEDDGAVRSLVLCRADAYNTITPELRDDMHRVLDDVERDDSVRVVLLRAEGRAFCAGYGLDWATATPAEGSAAAERERAWDSNDDLRMIQSFTRAWYRLHTLSKPVVAAVHGWCIGGGMNMVLHADLIVCAESARFGYPPSRVWGVPEAPWTWIARLGLEKARWYMLTGDEIDGRTAERLGLVLECVADDDLQARAAERAQRLAMVPRNQLQMLKRSLHETARHMYDPEGSMLVGCTFDGVARHTAEGLAFLDRAREVGFREAVRERDDPFGDYGSRPR